MSLDSQKYYDEDKDCDLHKNKEYNKSEKSGGDNSSHIDSFRGTDYDKSSRLISENSLHLSEESFRGTGSIKERYLENSSNDMFGSNLVSKGFFKNYRDQDLEDITESF